MNTEPRTGDDQAAPRGGWTVYRQDDNGQQFVVRRGLSREKAEALVAEYEARGHKQTYWAVRE